MSLQHHYTKHLDRLTIPVHSPFWARTHRGASVMITPQQYRLVAKVVPGWRGTQRTLAADLGYSLAGLNEAITTLTKLGVLARLSRRGHLGWTILRLQAGVHAVTKAIAALAANVRYVVDESLYEVRKNVPNIEIQPPPGGLGDGFAAFQALRQTLFAR